jgi:hypothetical protein
MPYSSSIFLSALSIVPCITHFKIPLILYHIQSTLGANINILPGHSIGHSKQNCVCSCSQYGAISLHSCKIVDKELLRIAYNMVVIGSIEK